MLIIPAIDIIGGKTVRLTKGDYNVTTFYDADPVDLVKKYTDHGFLRIHSVDLDGAKSSGPVNLLTLEKMASVDGTFIEWSGGIKSMQDAKDAFNAGASFISLGSVAVKNPALFEEMLAHFGPDKIILSADERDGKVAVKGWLESSELTVKELVNKFLDAPITQAIVTDISRDGTFQGIDTDYYRDLQDSYPSVIFTVSGGVGSIKDVEKAEEAKLKRIIVGKALYENRITLKELTEFQSY